MWSFSGLSHEPAAKNVTPWGVLEVESVPLTELLFMSDYATIITYLRNFFILQAYPQII